MKKQLTNVKSIQTPRFKIELQRNKDKFRVYLTNFTEKTEKHTKFCDFLTASHVFSELTVELQGH